MSFDPDNLVLVGAARAFLTGYAAYRAAVLPELTTLVGGDEDVVDNCDAVLAEFFGKTEA